MPEREALHTGHAGRALAQPAVGKNAFVRQGLPTHMSVVHAPSKAWIEMPRPVLSSGIALPM